jgi:multiple sugar transport system permease protein
MAASTNTQLSQPVQHRRPRSIPYDKLLGWAFLIFWVLITLFPIYWIARLAFSTQRDLLADPTSLLPVNFTFDAFKRVLGLVPVDVAIAQGGFSKVLHFWLYLRNTVIVALLVTGGSLIFNSLAAYAFARLRFPGRDKIFYIYIITLVMPTVLNLIPNFVLIHQLGWIGTLHGIAMPGFLGSAFGVFFLRQFFLSLNGEIEEAAKLDGAGVVGIFWHVVVPMSVPALATIFILSFLGTWNDLQWPYFAGGAGRVEDATVLTVALLVFRAQQQSGVPDFTGMMAGTLISLLPMILVFIVLGRKMVDSIQFSGFK